MLENIIGKLVETTIIGGAFMYLLYFMVNNINDMMAKLGECLQRVSDTLMKIDLRMEHIENRICELERRDS